MAIGSTNRLISSRYSGKAQVARLRCRSSTFSTTITWNWRGRKITDSMASRVSANHGPAAKPVAPAAAPPAAKPAGSAPPPKLSNLANSGRAAARPNRSAGPSNKPQVTKTPMATKASSLTTDSSAIAATMPSWRSVVSRWRVPKATVKPASASAMYSVLSCHQDSAFAAATPGAVVSSVWPPVSTA